MAGRQRHDDDGGQAVADLLADGLDDRDPGGHRQAGRSDQLAGLARIGIDEIAHCKGHRYLTVVVDHDTGRLVWAKEGRSSEVVHVFFDDLAPGGPRR